jgi:hypothetical protein
MKQIFEEFADLAATVLAERWQAIQSGQSGSRSEDGIGNTDHAATVRLTVEDAQGATSAHATIEHRPD